MTDKPMHSKAIEAGARAIFAQRYRSGEYVFGEYLPGTEFSRSEAQAAIAAYLAAMEAEGFSFVQTRQIEVVSGPPIYDPRPNVKG